MPPDGQPSAEVLAIDRFRVRHLVPGGASSSIPQRFERVLRQEVTRSISAGVLGRVIDPRVIFIRRIVMRLNISATWSDRQLGDAIRRAILNAVSNALRHAPDDHVVVFANCGEFVGSYLLARATGSEGRAWFYRRFGGMCALTPSMAIRTIACQDPEVWLQAIRTLRVEQQQQVLGALLPVDARVVLERLAAGGPNSGEQFEHAVQRSIELWHRATPQRHASSGSTADVIRRALFWSLFILRSDDQLPPWAAAKTATALSWIQHGIATSADGTQVATISHRLDLNAPKILGLGLFGSVRPVLGGPLGARLVQAVREHVAASRVRGRSPSLARQTRHLGGPFLLLPFLESACYGLAGTLESIHNTLAASLVRYVVLRYCLGENGPQLARDALWRELLGLTPQLSDADLDTWLSQPREVPRSEEPPRCDLDYLAGAFANPFSTPLRRALAAAAHRVLRSFATGMRGFHNTSLPHLYANFLNCSATLQTLEDRLHVVLSKPPLHVLLTMSTLMGRPHTIDWLHQRPLYLTFQGTG